MKVLGIESTAHTFGVGVVSEDEVLCSVKSMFEPDEGGIHPRKAAEHHYQHALEKLNEAKQKSADFDELDAIAFSQGPGIPQCLDVGAVVARSLAEKHDIPLLGVNHCLSHISIGTRTTNAEDPTTLYVSGGNSQIIEYRSGRYRVIGETQDIALGNALDKLARDLGYPHPGGPEIENQAGKTDEIIELSYPIKGMDFSFSGLVTETQRKIGDVEEPVLCNSFQEHAYAAVVEALERAMSQSGSKEALLTGGVAMNSRLREMVEKMCEQRDAEAYFPPPAYCMDNGAMIAHQGLIQLKNGDKGLDLTYSGVKPGWRPDQVEVDWI
ncbi:KEOPS complex N(6)-L-threonylcarbamoyladenine synthase Kae1 [Candidatus Nanohalobium constans]|uniref:N(6)-L-threonylcarbamoyladenine synthase n=1 Tax=Candidatus Nanohalobium constans TaxID=2565781 RepID=A0A5Q0UIE6_9ARCH|nr:KEOPS complex N(6)-L-threonylcarbamoyladenine synthase Kae1 [Candidatus Nanohalobium constans]QGA80659.1 bifunctional N6-L-threonylcarbamoyladenine synthase / protein kinase Bud32 [Candidatus Nanohalobium constans]